MKIRTACLTDCGGRENNDDTVKILSQGDNLRVFVGDGLGGYAGGQMASEVACRTMMEASSRSSMLTDSQLLQAVARANQAVFDLQKAKNGRMKTTIVFLAIEDGVARWAHVGDSRLYHFRDGLLVSQTIDHSVSQMAVLMGEITQDQIRFHEDRNRVLRALGAESAKPELSAPLMLTGGQDVFLLCTDGFWEYVKEPEMEKALRMSRSPEQWLKTMEMILKSRIPPDNDNYTAAAVFF